MQTIHQLVAGFRFGDAISNAAIQMRKVFRGWGCRSDILSRRSAIASEYRDEGRDLKEAAAELGPDDIAVLHLSIGNPVNLAFRDLRCRKAIVYHNITPSKYFRLLSPSTAKDLDEGRRHLEMLAGAADLNLADSAYNAAELTAAGYRDAKVLALPIDLDSFLRGGIDTHTQRLLGGGVYNVLFVGRWAPNKKIEDLLTVMYYLTKIEPNVRFVHVGTEAGAEAYYALVRAHGKALGLTNAVALKGVSQDALNTCYASAHAFLCMSEHEGFCAPLVEAMLHQVPVLSLASAAIPETLGGAGVLFEPPPDFPLIAETVAEVLHNDALRAQIIARQNKRIEALRARDLDADMKALFAPLLRP